MKTIKIHLTCIMIVLLLVLTTGCSPKEYKDLKHVYYNEILAQEEYEYYVYLYRHDCAVCSQIEENIIEYYKNYKKYDLPKLYVLNKGDTVNNAGVNSTTDETPDFVGTKNYLDIKTSTSPYLIRVRNGKVIAVYDKRSLILEVLTLNKDN